MTLDEVIAQERAKAQEQRYYANFENNTLMHQSCVRCAEEHEQLAEWLEELKAYQQQHIALCEKYDVNTVEEIYVKAIDDFTKELKDCFIIPHVVKVIEMEAEQLKVVE